MDWLNVQMMNKCIETDKRQFSKFQGVSRGSKFQVQGFQQTNAEMYSTRIGTLIVYSVMFVLLHNN
ncbi:hypothetical protein T09_3257 [Trichinella sp. T9]|nr:hypothetical protein T09_3257 [Trichinella sp. T9]